MDLTVQAKLLKVLEEKSFRRMGDVRERSVDVRLLAATHHDLLAAVTEKRFRADLYYRISTVTVNVPALRERREDIVPLAHFLLSALGEHDVDFDADARRALVEHSWPGNLRELRNVVERALVLREGRVICLGDLSFDRTSEGAFQAARPSREPGPARTLSDMEREHIADALEAEGGRVEAAARRLGVPHLTARSTSGSERWAYHARRVRGSSPPKPSKTSSDPWSTPSGPKKAHPSKVPPQAGSDAA